MTPPTNTTLSFYEAPSSDKTLSPALPSKTEVLIVGAGPVGLTLAGLLGSLGVSCVVVERRADHIKAPAAHVLRHGPRHVLALLGVDDAIDAAEPPLDMHYITWCTTLGGPELGRLDIRGELNAAGKPLQRPWTNLSQNRLEPILASTVSHMNGVEVRYATRCDSITQEGEFASAVLTLADGTSQSVTANWIVAADGAGSRTRAAIGAELVGQGPLGRFFMVHFRADLSPWILDRPGPICWLMNPEASGTLIVHDIASSHVFMTAMNGSDGEEAEIPARLAAALGVNVDLEIVTVDTWVPFCQVVDRYRHGRVLLVGDAAHRFPPSGGLGLNTGIMEAHNLAWKLALVQRGVAHETLIDTYDTECRPAATTNATDSFDNALRLLNIYEVLGPCATLVDLEQRLATMSTDDRDRLASAVEDQRSHFLSNGVFPSTANEPAPIRWPSPYNRFTIHLVEPTVTLDDWQSQANVLATEFAVTVTVDVLDAAPQADVTAFVTRPDGIVVWSTKQPSDHERDAQQIATQLRQLLRSGEATK